MLSHQSAAVLSRWPVPALLCHLQELRQVDARRRLDEFHLAMAAARGGEDGVKKVTQALSEAAGKRSPTAGDPEDLMAALAGG